MKVLLLILLILACVYCVIALSYRDDDDGWAS